MKGQLKLIRGMLQKASKEGLGGVSDKHVRIAHAMTGDDLSELLRNGSLPTNRVISLESDQKAIQETFSLIKVWLNGPTDEQLKKHGVTIRKLDEGTYAVGYQEKFPSSDEQS